MKFDKKVLTGSLPLAVELVASTVLFIALGYLVGGLISDLARVVGMCIGALLGLGFFVYRITKKFQ